MFTVTEDFSIRESTPADLDLTKKLPVKVFPSHANAVGYIERTISERLLEIDNIRQALLHEQKTLKTKLDSYATTS